MPAPAPWVAPFKTIAPPRHSLTSMFSGVQGVEELQSLSLSQQRAVLELIRHVTGGSASY